MKKIIAMFEWFRKNKWVRRIFLLAPVIEDVAAEVSDIEKLKQGWNKEEK